MRDNYATVTGSSTVTIKAKDSNANRGSQNNSNKNNVNQNNGQNNGRTDGNAGVSRVQTGDESHIFFYAVMLIASAFGILKNRNREEKRKL